MSEGRELLKLMLKDLTVSIHVHVDYSASYISNGKYCFYSPGYAKCTI